MIAATRQPNTPEVSGSGTLLGLVVKALKAGQHQPFDCGR